MRALLRPLMVFALVFLSACADDELKVRAIDAALSDVSVPDLVADEPPDVAAPGLSDVSVPDLVADEPPDVAAPGLSDVSVPDLVADGPPDVAAPGLSDV